MVPKSKFEDVPWSTKCGMNLLPESIRFALLRHMMSNPVHLLVMAAVMLALMAAAMMMMRGP
jgi:hypothetical protein